MIAYVGGGMQEGTGGIFRALDMFGVGRGKSAGGLCYIPCMETYYVPPTLPTRSARPHLHSATVP